MLERVNNLSRNVVLLLSIFILAVTSIVVTLLVVDNDGGKSSTSDLVTELQDTFEDEYGIRPTLSISVYDATTKQAEEVSKQLAKDFDMGDPEFSEYEGTAWYNLNNRDDLEISVFIVE